MNLKPPIAILGGTFDPVHNGHLTLAKLLLEALPISDVGLMPCYRPAHRDLPAASAEDRLAMLQLATKALPHVHIETCELDRQGVSYMIDSLPILEKKYPNTPLCLVIGSDAFAGFDRWKNYHAILNHCHLIVIDRPGQPLETHSLSLALQQLHRAHHTIEATALTDTRAGSLYQPTLPNPNLPQIPCCGRKKPANTSAKSPFAKKAALSHRATMLWRHFMGWGLAFTAFFRPRNEHLWDIRANLIELSATTIRQQLKKQQSPTDALPTAVLEYIQHNALYRFSNSSNVIVGSRFSKTARPNK